MLEVPVVRERKEEIIAALAKRNIEAAAELDNIIALDDKRKAAQAQLDATLAEMNSISKEVGNLFKDGKREEAEALKQKTATLKQDSHAQKEAMEAAQESLLEALKHIPNIPHSLVPAGRSSDDNEIVEEFGNMPELSGEALPHWELAKKYNLIDFELGVKISGAGFPVYRGKGARLERALISFFLDEAIAAGYEEVIPPHLVNEASGFGTGQLPDKEGQMYHVTSDNLYLIPTAEVPVTNILRDSIVKHDELPIKLTAYSPCFRREAGSYGKDVRGLNRVHQFNKVEIVQVCHPSDSYATLDKMVAHVKNLLEKLELPSRIARLCGGDLGFTSALTYDMEVFSAAQKKWLEVSSISNFETYQANRLKLRFKDETGKSQLAHTLNGSALALPRIFASILENNQSEAGIAIPKALVPYTGFEYIA